MRIDTSGTSPLHGRDSRGSRGFTLVELMVTLVVMAVVVVVLASIMYAISRNKTAQMNRIESSQGARVIAEKLSSDLRSAGYGVDDTTTAFPTQNPIAYIDSVQVLLNANLSPYPDTSATLGHQSPLAYNPAGSPKPFPLSGTAWTPGGKYHTGAEIVRWTLDINNDGQVNASDVNGTDAGNTPNPNDYVLVRQVWGDSTGNIAGNNGGSSQAVALVRKPGGTVPALFTVYLRDVSAPWNWNNGPIPVSKLDQIERVVVNITSPSSRPDAKGNYSETSYRTEIASMRNVPNFISPESSVDGYVYDDKNFNHVYDAGDVPIPNAVVRLGTVIGYTSSLGYYRLMASPGTYLLAHTAPAGYGPFTTGGNPTVTLPPDQTVSFADTAAHGGWITLTTFLDGNSDGIKQTGEVPVPAVKFTLNPGNQVSLTGVSGVAQMFAGVGNFTVSIVPPDSFAVTTANPVTGSMTNGGSFSANVGVRVVPSAQVQGKVFTDLNKNGTLDAGETGLAGAWVGCTTDGGVTVLAYTTTDASGNYTLNVPSNSPPATVPYSIMLIPISGYYGTSTTSINGVYLTTGQILTGQNFGLAAFQVISLSASRVLSLGNSDLVEHDWPGNSKNKERFDTDIVLGADANGSDQISVWFNQYNGTPLFNSARDYSRSAPNSVLSMVVDSLNRTPPVGRADLVTGTKTAAAGNFFVWFCQGTSSNEGYYPASYSLAYRTTDNGDVQSVLTPDVAGGTGADIVVGTNAGGYTGTIEVWQNNDDSTTNPTFTRVETYPPAGAIGGAPAWLGEVSSMVLADLDRDGDNDLIVGLRTSATNGSVMIFKYNGKTTGNRYVYRRTLACNDQVNAVTALDVDGDGWIDIVVGTQHNTSSGNLMLWKNNQDATNLNFANNRTVAAPGIPLCLDSADFLGVSRKDVVVGYRATTTSYVGGVRIYPTDTGTLPASGYDPSGGTVVNMVPAVTIANFNYGVEPSLASPPYLPDLAIGVKITDTTGALVVLVR